MDAGLAAVLGALAGAAATTGAALVTGWSTREQAKIAARAEHRRQRRDKRQVAYEEFINAVTELIINTVVSADATESHFSKLPTRQQIETFNDSIVGLTTKVMLAGPSRVTTGASAVRLRALQLATAVLIVEALRKTDGEGPGCEDWVNIKESHEQLTSEFAKFSRDAQMALDDDGVKAKP